MENSSKKSFVSFLNVLVSHKHSPGGILSKSYLRNTKKFYDTLSEQLFCITSSGDFLLYLANINFPTVESSFPEEARVAFVYPKCFIVER